MKAENYSIDKSLSKVTNANSEKAYHRTEVSERLFKNNQSTAGSMSAGLAAVEPFVATTLILSATPAILTAGGIVSHKVYFNPPSVQEVNLELSCDSFVQSFTTSSSENASTVQTFQVDATAIGQCSLQANSTSGNYTSNVIQLTVNQQLYFASSLLGWVGGQFVDLTITSPNTVSGLIPYTISCPLQSTGGDLLGSTLWSFTLPDLINGVGCIISTQYEREFYLNLQPTFVNIAMSQN